MRRRRERRFAETPGGPHRVATEWSCDLLGETRALATTFDGQLVDAEPRRPGAGAPWVYRLPDGRLLRVLPCVTHLFLPTVDVRIDGRPLPGSAFDPTRFFGRSRNVLLTIAALRLGTLSLAVVTQSPSRSLWDTTLDPAVVWASQLFLVAAAYGLGRGSRAAGVAAIAAMIGSAVLVWATWSSVMCLDVPLVFLGTIVTFDTLLDRRRTIPPRAATPEI